MSGKRSDLNLTLRLTSEGGQVVVRSVDEVSTAVSGANKNLNETAKAGETAKQGLSSASASSKELDNNLSILKKSLGLVAGVLATLGITGFFGEGIADSQELTRNMLRTESVIRSMGNAAGISAKELAAQARALAEDTGKAYNVDAIMRAQQVMLTYSTVVGDTYRDSIDLAIDLSALMGGDVVRSVEQLGRALDDPIKGIQALADSGYRFADSQKAMWKEMAETGRLAEAQTSIIAELRMQVGGLAQNEVTELERAEKRYALALSDTKAIIAEHLQLDNALADIYTEMAAGLKSINAAITSGDFEQLTPTLQAAVQTAEIMAYIIGTAGVVAFGKYALAQAAVLKGKLLLNTQATRTVSALGLVTTAAGKSTITMNALGLATKVALGPVGLLITAVTTAALVFDSLEASAQAGVAATAQQAERIDKLAVAYERMSNAAFSAAYADAQREIITLTQQRIDAEEKLANLATSTGNSEAKFSERVALQQVIDDINASMLPLEEKLAALQQVFNNGLLGIETYKELVTETTAPVEELNTSLLSLYNTQKLAAEAVDQHGRALTGIDLELFKAQFKEVGQLPADAEAAIRQFVKTAEAAAKTTAADAALKSLQAETQLLKTRLQLGEDEYDIQKALYQLKGGDPAVLAAIETELRLQQELQKQITINEELTGSAFKRSLEDISALSSAGQQFGDALTQAFGRVAQQIDGMTASQLSYNRQLEDLAKKRKEVEKLEANSPKRAAALLDIQRTEARLGREHFQAQIGQYAALTGAAAQMFGEQSKEREALHKMEVAFSAVEMALALERAAASALAAIANQGSGDPYTAFARIAAMAAIMAGLGLFSGSVSSSANLSADRQASQGTGTVLGDSDAKSASIGNALDRIADLSLDQYVELRSINSSIKALSSGIANLAVSLVGNFGRFNEQSYGGELGTTKQFQASDNMASFLAAGIYAPIDKLLGGIGGSVLNSVLGGLSKTTKTLVDSGISFEAQRMGEILATGIVDAAWYNTIETTKRKAFGLSKKRSTNTEYSDLSDDLNAEFGRIFGHVGNSINAAVEMLGLDVTRSLDNFVINLPNISFKDLSGDEIAAELEAVFSQQADLMARYILPSMSQYQQMGEGLYDTLIRVAQEQAVFNAQLDALGLQLGDVSAALRIDVAQSIIELMGGIEAFRDATSEYFSSFYSDAEQFDYLSKTVNQAFSSLGLSVPATREQFKSMVDALDLTTDAGQQLFAQLMQLVPGLDQYFTGLDAQTTEFEDAAQRLADALAQQLGAINNVLQSIGNDILSLQRTLPGFDNIAYITGQIEQLTGALSGSDSLDEQLDLTQQLRAAVMERYNAELAAMSEVSRQANELYKAEQDAYKAELAAVQALNKAAENLSKTAASMLIGDLSPLTTGQRLSEAQSQFDAALAAARGGDADAYGLVQSLGQQILQLQKEFNPAAYTDVFGDIKAIFDELGSNLFEDPEAPALHPDVIAYEDAKVALAEQTIAELQRLQEQTALLREIAQQDYQSQLQQLPIVNGAVKVDNSDVVKQIKELQAAQVAASQQAAQQAAAQAAKQQQQMQALEQQQSKIWRAISDNSDMMQQMMRR